jgi:hypothetical protein
VESTVPALLRTCAVNVSNAVVVVVSAVSTCSQKVRVAAVALEAIETCCITVSVCVVPKPSSHASQVPVCGGSLLELLITPEDVVHGAGLVDPFSNPGLPSICVVVPPPPAAAIVRAIVIVCVTVPPVAVTVTFAVPVVAVALAVNVSVELPLPGAAMEVGLKLAVTPAGKPEAERVTAELNPPLTALEMVELPEAPCVTDRLPGDALRVKFGVATALTVTGMVTVCVSPPPVAVTVALNVPVVAVLLAVKVRVELPVPGAAMEAGLKLAVTPAGMPEAERLTAELNPPLPEVEMVVVAELPWLTAKLVGAALTVKSGPVPGLKTMSSTGCSSIPLGATPVWPWRKSNMPAPVTFTGMLAVWKLVVAVNLASNSDRALVMPGRNGLPDPTHVGEGISAIMVLPDAS